MQNVVRSQFVLPLPSFILHRYTAVFIAVIHAYLSIGHLSKLFGGDVEWTHIWKGFGRLGVALTCLRLWRRGGLPDRKLSSVATRLVRRFAQRLRT
jgi:hypothetical protein